MSDLQVPENNVIKSKAMEKEQTFMGMECDTKKSKFYFKHLLETNQ